MTTAPAQTPGSPGAAVAPAVRRPVMITSAAGAIAAVLGAVAAGSPAAGGAGLGAAMVVVFFGFGALVLGVVARLAPAASLLVALLTYTLKVVLLGLLFLALTRSGALEDAVDPRWLGGTVIGCTLVWLITQIVASTRSRQPLYDLPAQGSSQRPEASVR